MNARAQMRYAASQRRNVIPQPCGAVLLNRRHRTNFARGTFAQTPITVVTLTPGVTATGLFMVRKASSSATGAVWYRTCMLLSASLTSRKRTRSSYCSKSSQLVAPCVMVVIPEFPVIVTHGCRQNVSMVYCSRLGKAGAGVVASACDKRSDLSAQAVRTE